MKAFELKPPLCPKEVATLLGVSERTAVRLMSSGQIASFRAGQKLWRTKEAHVFAYQSAAFNSYRRKPAA